jgi:hypothetical protein
MPTGDGRLGELRAATYGRGIWQIPLITAHGLAEPAISLSATALDFGSQAVATSSNAQTITVTNTGSAALTISQVAVTGDFNEANTCTSAPISAGLTCTVQIHFLPTQTGSRAGLLTVYGNVPGGQAAATLSGTGTPAAAVILDPIALDFAATVVNATSAVRNITISNTAGTTVTLQSLSVAGAGFQISASTCGSTLKAGSGCTVSITFTPAALGASAGTLSVTDDFGTQITSLTGTGTSPATDALSPLSLTFASQQLTTVSASQQVTLTNSGGVALTLISAQITSGDFTVSNGCGASLNPHSTCALNVFFQPQRLGLNTGVLTVSDEYRTQTIALSGAGVAPPGVSLSPLYTLNFPDTGVGQTALPQTVTLTNNGGAPLLLQSTAVSGDFAIVPGSDTCGAVLAPANACTLQIVFTPTSGGSRSGELTITDSAPNSPQVLRLTGFAADFILSADGDTTVTVKNGQNAVFPLLFTPSSTIHGAVTLTCAGAPLNAACNVTPSSITPDQPVIVSVVVLTGVPAGVLSSAISPRLGHRMLWLAMLLPLGLFTLRRARLPALARLLLFCMLFPIGCGAGRQLPASSSSGGSSPGQIPVTPAGTYPIVASATNAGVTRTIKLTLIVQ